MGIIVGFVIMLTAAAIAAAAASVVLVGLTAIVAHRTKRGPAMARAAVGPFAAAVWCVFVILLHASVFDVSFSKGPVGYGYEVAMYDTSDTIVVQSVKPGQIIAEPEVRFSKRLQVVGPFVLAELQPRSQYDTHDVIADRFVLFDMRSRSASRFPDEGALRAAVASRNIQLALEPAYNVYARYTSSWFDILCWLLALLPLGIALVLHFRRVTYPLQTASST